MNHSSHKHSAKIVTAGLMAALAVSGVAGVVAPTIASTPAFAEGASLQSANELTGAKLTGAEDGNEHVLTKFDDIQFAVGSGSYLVPTEITGKDEVVYNLLDSSAGFSTVYKNADGDVLTHDELVKLPVGKYTVTVTNKNGASVEYGFSVVSQTLKGAVAFVDHGTGDVSDTDLTYTGSEIKVGFAVDGVAISDSDYDVKFYKANTKVETTVEDAGNYTARVTGKNNYAGTTAEINFTVHALDLSKGSVSIADTDASTGVDADWVAANLLVGGSTMPAGVASDVDVELKSNPLGGTAYFGDLGTYTVTVTAKKDSKNVTGTTDVTFHNVTSLATNFTYAGVAFSSYTAASPLTIDPAEDEAFSAGSIAVAKPDGSGNFKKAELDVTYVDLATGKAVDAAQLAKPGTYQVKVNVKTSEKDNWAVGGASSFVVRVARATSNADKNVTFTYKGKIAYNKTNVAGVATVYDGTDVLKEIGCEVTDNDGNKLTEGTDYTLSVTDENHKEVKEIVDAGTYTVAVKSDSLNLTGDATLVVKVAKISFADLSQTLPGLRAQGGKLTYTGSEISVPGAEYLVRDGRGNGVKDEDGNQTYKALDPSLYSVTSIKDKDGNDVKTLKDAGTYTVNIKLTDEAAKNYRAGTSKYTVEVHAYKSYADVSSTDWFAEPVALASQFRFMNGYGGTALFGPYDPIKRADAVIVLYNMAGEPKVTDDSGSDNYQSWNTGFADCDNSAYYAKALVWAKKAGIAKGYGDGTNFGPNDNITREQFAALLQRYASIVKKDVAEGKNKFEAMPDANQVSAWATEAVKWAVEHDIMGNAGQIWPGNTISRAEVATMATNFQPDGQLKLGADAFQGIGQ